MLPHMVPPLVVGGAALTLLTAAAGAFSAAPWLPTRRRERTALLGEITLIPGQVVYDLGCGTGTVLFALASREPAARYIGYEIAILPWLLGLLHKRCGGARFRNVSLRLRDFFGQTFDDANLVFVFLTAPAYPKLMKKLAGRLKPDARVVAEAWPFPGLDPERKIAVPNGLPLYVYRGEQFK